MESIQESINHTIAKKKQGDIFFPAEFRGKGTASAIKKSLSRLAAQKKISRLANGIYYIPKNDPLFGDLKPSAEQVAQLIARKEKVRIRPAGAYALNRLGLSTQVPMKLVYITDGEPRRLTIGKTQIVFKSTTPKKLSAKGAISGLLLQGLEELDLHNMPFETELKIKELLQKENPRHLQHDLELAPAKIHDYLIRLLQKREEK
ncbi:MAG TPA: DUF6088 family protein [Puia sp.]